MNTATTTSLQDVVLDALSLAIGPLKEEYAHCRGCLNSPEDHCLYHQPEYERVKDFEDAERQIRADSFGAWIRLARGTEGSR